MKREGKEDTRAYTTRKGVEWKKEKECDKNWRGRKRGIETGYIHKANETKR